MNDEQLIIERKIHSAYVDGWNKGVEASRKIASDMVKRAEIAIRPEPIGMIDDAIFIGFGKCARRIAKQIKALTESTP